MGQTILNSFQKKILGQFKTTPLVKKYYLAGGTALAEFYLKHRRSEDLDFFTEEELDISELERFVHLVSKIIPQEKVEYQIGIKVDPLQLGENLFQVTKLADMPIMLKHLDRNEMESFFLKEAKSLEKGIWE